MPQSMTGFATIPGSFDAWRWVWDIRSVNGRGLELRLRLPDWIEGLEPRVRAALQGQVTRGNVTLSLRISRDETAGAVPLNPAALNAAFDQVAWAMAAAEARGIPLTPSTPQAILAMRGVLSQPDLTDTGPLADAVAADLPRLIGDFVAARATEGAALEAIVAAQIARIGECVEAARGLAAARAEHMAATLNANLARVMEGAPAADPDRVAQELALIAVKADVAEELDRLDAHVAAARRLLSEPGPVGRKLDFLSQEFNREANTLCSKAQDAELTRVGLDLKTLIDQMREQIQNME